MIAACQIQAIGALAGIEHKIGEVEPPGGLAQTLKRLGNLTYATCRFESRASFCPSAAFKRFIAGNALRWPG